MILEMFVHAGLSAAPCLAMRSPVTIGFFLSDEGPMLETLDYTIRIGSTPTFLYFDLYLYSAYAAHFVYYTELRLIVYFARG